MKSIKSNTNYHILKYCNAMNKELNEGNTGIKCMAHNTTTSMKNTNTIVILSSLITLLYIIKHHFS